MNFERLKSKIPRPILRFFQIVEFFAVKIVLQRVLGTLSLLFVYGFVIGATIIGMRLFFRKSLRHPTVNSSSGWVLSTGYDSSVESAGFQS